MNNAATTADETLVAETTRSVTFSIIGNDKVTRHIEARPAGTEVYVTRMARGEATIRIPGTLLQQRVPQTAISIP